MGSPCDSCCLFQRCCRLGFFFYHRPLEYPKHARNTDKVPSCTEQHEPQFVGMTLLVFYIYIYLSIYIIYISIYISIKLSKQLKVQNITIKSSFGDNICLDHLLSNKKYAKHARCLSSFKVELCCCFPLMRCCSTGQHSNFFPGVAKKSRSRKKTGRSFLG